MKKSGLFCVFIFFISFCTQTTEEIEKKMENGIEVVINHTEPYKVKGEPSTFTLKKGFSIDLKKEELAKIGLTYIYDFDVDSNGNIYILDSRSDENSIFKFDRKGNYLNSFCRYGQGPGEFNGFDPCLSKEGQLYIADWSQLRLTILDANLKILELSKMKLYGFIFRLDSKNNMYFLAVEPLPNTPGSNRQKLVFTKCSPSGEPVLRIHEYEWGGYRDNNGIYHTDAFRTQLRYKIDSKDNAYYAATDKYEINVISPGGEVIKRITKKGKSRKLTQVEINSFEPGKPNSRFVTDIPENMPYIADLFILENDFLLVVTFENGKDDDYLMGDLFDDEGMYLARVQIPKYYRWDYLIQPYKIGAVLKNNNFYTIESDENEERFWVKRYKLTLNY